MQKIVEIKFGSHLYGTATEASDLDIKAVFMPSAQDILLQRVQGVISNFSFKEPGEKNIFKDVDFECYSPDNFLRLLAEGKTVALDMIFAPDKFMLSKPDLLWREIQALTPKILTKNAVSFVRYCYQQANKYSIKGSRVAAARQVLELLSRLQGQYGPSERLHVITPEIDRLVKNNKFLSIGAIPQPDGSVTQYLEICGKKALLHGSIKSARVIAQRLVDEYGTRALAAEKNEGIDWKALSHAVRIGHEAIELLSTHKITFPRPEAEHLLDIKLGKLPFGQVSKEIDALLEKVEEATTKSTLPESYDAQIIDRFIENLYRKIVLTEADHA